MVVLSAAVLSRAKPLVARQFVEMTRLRVEGLLGAFLKLIEDGGRDYTYIETDSVRYVYLPVESLYLLLITNKTSNILGDLETLRLLQVVVQDACRLAVTEALVLAHAFDIVFAFDEVVSFGHREAVTLSQIKSFTSMESHEEKLQDMIRKTKEAEERERRKKIASRLDKERSKVTKQQRDPSATTGSDSPLASEYLPSRVVETPTTTAGFGTSVTTPAATGGTGAPKKGMQIGSKAKQADTSGLLSRLREHTPARAAESVEVEAVTAVNPLAEAVVVDVEEKVTGSLQAEGGVNELEIQGGLTVTVMDVGKAGLVAFQLGPEDQRFKYKVHPNIDRQKHLRSQVLEVKDASRAYRPNVPSPLVKWRATPKGDDADALLPFGLSCWPSESPQGTSVTLELNVNEAAMTATEVASGGKSAYELHDVKITFVCEKAVVAAFDVGHPIVDAESLVWVIPSLSKDSGTETFEFSTPTPLDELLPFTIEARAELTTCGLIVERTYHMERGEDISVRLNKGTAFSLTVEG